MLASWVPIPWAGYGRGVDLALKPRDRRSGRCLWRQIAWAAGDQPVIGKMRARSRCDPLNEWHAAIQSADFSGCASRFEILLVVMLNL